MERLEQHSSSPWGTSWREMLAALRRALWCLGFFAASTRWRAPAPRCWVPGKPCHSGRLWPGKQQPDPGLQTSWSCSGNCKRRERRIRTWSLVIYLSVQFGEAEIFPFVTGAFFLLCSGSTTEVWPTHSCRWDTNFHTSPSQASSRKSKASLFQEGGRKTGSKSGRYELPLSSWWFPPSWDTASYCHPALCSCSQSTKHQLAHQTCTTSWWCQWLQLPVGWVRKGSHLSWKAGGRHGLAHSGFAEINGKVFTIQGNRARILLWFMCPRIPVPHFLMSCIKVHLILSFTETYA